MSAEGALHIGTSGWNYDHWRGPFYPDDLPPKEWLAFYAQRLASVEVNYSFYKLPKKETFVSWRETVSEDFTFAVKASRYITHMKKLKDPQEPLERLYGRIEGLGDKLGPLLFQLPPNWRFDPERLEGFLKALAPGYRHVFEFRDERWINERAFELLAAHDVGFCIYELAGYTSPRWVTSDFAYIRLHGPGGAYQGAYSQEALGGWTRALSAWRQEGRDVHCFFDNDEAGYAVQNALQLQDMVQT